MRIEELHEVKLLFIGPPGAGKGTQATRVAQHLGVPHISTGDMFRHHVTTGTDLGRQVDAIMKAGEYVPDEITVQMLAERLAEPDAANGFILDGFPRTGGQVSALDGLIGEDGLDAVVVFEVDLEELTKRLLIRGRADDTEETIRNRFRVFTEQTAPLLEIYGERGQLVSVDGMGEMDEVTDRSSVRWTQRCDSGAMITIKSRREFAKMQKAGAAVAAIHEAVREAAVPGTSLLDLEAISVRILDERGCTSSFLGYHGTYPATLCLSPNDVIVHGIPSKRRLEEGDILSVDAGAIFEGFHGDAAFTVPIGDVDAAALELIEATERALWAGIEVVHKGGHIGDIGAAVAEIGEAHGYGIVEEYVGHGIGRQMHEEPQVPNHGVPGRG